MAKRQPRVIRYGNDLYRKIAHPGANSPLNVTYWNVWIAMVLTDAFGGDWEKMIGALRNEGKRLYQRDALEGLLNHMRMLRQTLSEAGLNIADILKEADASFLKSQKTKARRKILEMGFRSKERSAWMINTPRKLCKEKAMRGQWDRFPVGPESYAYSLEGLYKSSGYYSENQSFALEGRLSSFVEKHEARASHAELFALYRSFLTVVVDKMDMVDDSFGVVGDLYEEVFEKYFRLDRTAFDMEPVDFFLDFIELIIWEDYGGTHRHQPDFFAGLSASEVPVVEYILQEEWDELNKLELQYQAEKALTMLGLLYVQHRFFDKFVPMAEAMGVRHWERITRMANMAEKHRKYDLALAVFEACLGPGSHEKFLRKEYKELKSRLDSKGNS